MMATIGKAQIEVAVDAAGVDVGVSKAKRSLAGLADAAAAAGERGKKGVAAIGDGSDAAAKKVEQSTKALINSIQRTTAAMDAGSKSGADYYRALAGQRGVDANVLKPYLDQLSAAKAKQDALANSTRTTIPTFHTLTGAISSAQNVLAGFAAAAGITWAAGLVKGAIDGMAALHTLSERTGATVEGLSALRGAAKLSGTDMDQVARSMQLLSKNMVTLDDDGKAATKAIAAIGLSADDLRKMKPDEAFKAIADALAQYEGGAQKVAVAQALMGKSGADMLPMLGNLAESGKLQAKVTAEQADQAYEFEKSLVKLGATGQGWQKEIAAGMLPALNAFAGALLSVSNEAGGLRNATAALSKDGSINAWATEAINAASHVADAFAGVVRVVQLAVVAIKAAGQYRSAIDDIHGMGPLAAVTSAGRDAVEKRQAELFKALDSAGTEAKDLLTTPLIGERIRDAFKKTADAKAKAMSDYAAAEKAVTAAYAGSGDKVQKAALDSLKSSYFGAPLKQLDFTPTKEKKDKAGGGGGVDPEVTQYNQLSEALDKYNTQLAAELAGEAKLTESQKIGLEVKRKLNAADQESFKSALEKARGLEIALEMQKLWQQAEEEARKSEQARADAMQQSANAITADAAKIREHTLELGLSQSAIDAIKAARDADTLATRQNELAILDAAGVCTAYSEALRDNIAALAERGDALKADSIAQASADASKKAAEDWKQTSAAIEQSLTDALMRGFESGKDFAVNLRDTLVNLFKTLVLRPVIQATLSTTGLVSGAAGATTTDAATAATTGSYGSIGNMLGTVKSAYDMITGGASNTYAAIAKSSVGQSLGLSSVNSGGLGVPSVAGGVLDSSSYTTTQLTTLGESVGTGLATVGAGIIGSSIGNAIAGDKRIISGISGSTVGAAIGAIAGPIGSVVGGVLGGVLDAAFGSGQKQVKASGISGTFSGSGFEGQSWDFWRKSGGWLGGGKKGTDYSPLDASTSTALSSSFALLKLQTGAAADALGVDTAQIAAYSKQIQLQLTDDATANSKAIADMLGGISDDLAQLALAGSDFGQAGETAAQTLTRLSSSLIAVNDGLSLIHLQSLQVSLAGGDLASKLATASGGIEAFKTSVSAYYDAYFSEAEKQQDLTDGLTKSFAAMGEALPDSKESFRALVESLDLTTTAGQGAFAGMMSLAGAFSQMTEAADAAASAASSAAQSLVDRYSTDQQRQVKAQVDLAIGFAKLGVSAPQSAAAFRALADTADTSTAAGQALVAGLKELSPAFDTVQSASKSWADAMQAAQDQVQQSIIAAQQKSASERAGLQTQWDQLTGNTVALRQAELASIDEYNRALQQQIWAYQDAQAAVDAAASASDAAFAAVKKAIDAQKEAQQAVVTAAQTSLDAVQSVFDLLKSEVAKLYGTTAAAASGQEFITRALATAQAGGALPETVALQDAITGAAGGFGNAASQFDADRSRLLLAGQLSQLQDIAGGRLTDSQSALQAAQDQLTAMDAILSNAQTQLDTLRGINDSTLTVADAVEALQVALTGEKTARQRAAGAGNALAPSPVIDPLAAFENMVRKLFASGDLADVQRARDANNAIGMLSGGGRSTDINGDLMPEAKAVIAGLMGQAISDGSFDLTKHSSTSGNNALVAEIKALREEVKALRVENAAQQTAIATNTGQSARVHRRWDGDGLPDTRTVT